MQSNYNPFIQKIHFHGLFRNALRCRKNWCLPNTGALTVHKLWGKIFKCKTVTLKPMMNTSEVFNLFFLVFSGLQDCNITIGKIGNFIRRKFAVSSETLVFCQKRSKLGYRGLSWICILLFVKTKCKQT